MAMGGDFGGGSAADSTMRTLTLLADPVALAARIKELRAAEDQANSAIALAGPASEIIELRKQAELDRAAAAEEFKRARDESDKIVEEADAIKAKASAAYLEVKRNAEAEAKAIIDGATQTAAEASAKLEDATARTAELHQRYLELAAREKANTDRAAELDKLANDLEDRRKQYELAGEALRKLTEG